MYRSLFLLLGITALLAASCRKDDSISCAPQVVPEPLTLAQFRQRHAVPVQTFGLQLGQSQTLTTSGGAQLTFPANGLLLPDGSVATGTAQVLVREIYTVPDMLLSNVPTGSPRQQGGLLISGGEFNIRVFQGSTRLRLSSQYTLALQSPIPALQDTTRQYVWQGTVLPPDTMLWRQNTAATNVAQQGPNYFSQLPLDSIGWWNIDQLHGAYASRPLVSLSVRIPTADESLVFLRPVGYNGLYYLYKNGNGLSTDWYGVVPSNTLVEVLVLQAKNGQLYYGTQRITIQQTSLVEPAVTAVSEAEAVRLIRLL